MYLSWLEHGIDALCKVTFWIMTVDEMPFDFIPCTGQSMLCFSYECCKRNAMLKVKKCMHFVDLEFFIVYHEH